MPLYCWLLHLPLTRTYIMMLTGSEIKRRLGHEIIITPFSEEQLNPNSYNLRLYPELLVYTDQVLDALQPNATRTIRIPEEGIVLEPGELYLARTEEYTETYNLVPRIIGRSSVGRLGITVHLTSGFGDVGFRGNWTLQLTCVKPVRIYPHMKICQIFYTTTIGEISSYESSKYQDSNGIMASQLYRDTTR